jgi:hypothetical protein
LCELAIAYDDTPERYVMRLAELVHIEKTIPVAMWDKSSYPEELERMQLFLSDAFEHREVAKWLAHWNQAIAAGRHVVVELEGAYV